MAMITAQEEHLSLARMKEEEEEIGVFGAEKYFNRGMDEECPKAASIGAAKQQYKKEDTIPMKPISTDHHRAPSTRSESSGNSQIALLQKAKKARAKSFLARFSCKCVCSDKNSVDAVEEQGGEISFRTSTRSGLVHAKPIPKDDPIKTVSEVPWTKEEAHAQKMDKLAIGQKKEISLADDARNSLQVFGSPVADKRNKYSFSIENRLAELASKANPKMLEEETEFAENEPGSDASSDLFEIESLTSKANPFLAVQGSDVPSATTIYAPSEASIEWSVVTASAVDLSVLSDSEEQRPKTKSSKQIVQRRRPNILLSCKSHKSVRVAGDAYVATDKVSTTNHVSVPMTPVTRFQAENKMAGFYSKQQHGLAKHKLNQSRSPRASHLF